MRKVRTTYSLYRAFDPPSCFVLCCRMGGGCRGNRLEWVPGSNKTKLVACFPHHKNESRWDHLPIQFELPPSLTHTVMPWVEAGHKMTESCAIRVLQSKWCLLSICFEKPFVSHSYVFHSI
jgi:hypothetical protein